MKTLITLALALVSVSAFAEFGPIVPQNTFKIWADKIMTADKAYTDQKVAQVQTNSSAAVTALAEVVVSNKAEAAAALATAKTDLEGQIAAVKPVVIEAKNYGFDENLRSNQVVTGSALVDAVLAKKTVAPVLVKAGDYSFVVGKFLEANDATLGAVKGFASANADLTAANLQAAIAEYTTSGILSSANLKTEKLLIVFVDGKTYSFYLND